MTKIIFKYLNEMPYKFYIKAGTKEHRNINSTLYDIAQNHYSKSNDNLMESYDNKLLKDALLEQTKATQYASYAAANAAYQQEWYINQYRQRLL